MRTAFIDTLCTLAAADSRIWLLTGDLGYSVLERFAEQFPERFVNVGVAEQNLAGVAAGLAHSGKMPFIYSIANFPTLRCLEQIRNDICYHDANVKIVSVGGGFAYGPQGYTHHGVEDLAIMRALGNITVIAPGDPVEAHLATLAVAQKPGPCYLRLGKANEQVLYRKLPHFEIGKAIVARRGRDVTLISTGGMLAQALQVAAQLASRAVSARVLSMHTLKPIDSEALLTAARETRALVTMEEHRLTGGLGSAVAEVLSRSELQLPPFEMVGVPDGTYHAVGDQAYLRRLAGDLFVKVQSMLAVRMAA